MEPTSLLALGLLAMWVIVMYQELRLVRAMNRIERIDAVLAMHLSLDHNYTVKEDSHVGVR